MALSEDELRMLEQMERALVEEDPKFASTLRGTSLRSVVRRRAVVAGIVFVVGVAVMMAGVVMQLIPVGIVGFLVMLGSATLGLSAIRGQHGHPAPAPEADPKESRTGFTVVQGGKKPGRSRKPRTQGSFMERMEDRWRRRREGGGY